MKFTQASVPTIRDIWKLKDENLVLPTGVYWTKTSGMGYITCFDSTADFDSSADISSPEIVPRVLPVMSMNSELESGTQFSVLGIPFVVIDKYKAIAMESIGIWYYNEEQDGHYYSKTQLRKGIDEWFELYFADFEFYV